MTDEFKATAVKLVEECAGKIMEHVDSVQIFITKRNDTGESTTLTFECGRGNFHARMGHVAEWLDMQREFARCEARRIQAKEDESD